MQQEATGNQSDPAKLCSVFVRILVVGSFAALYFLPTLVSFFSVSVTYTLLLCSPISHNLFSLSFLFKSHLQFEVVANILHRRNGSSRLLAHRVVCYVLCNIGVFAVESTEKVLKLFHSGRLCAF